MEIWILIGAFLAFGLVSFFVCEAYENIQMSRWMHQRHMRELKLAMMQLEHPEFFSRTHDVSADEIRKALDIYKTSGVTTTLPTGGVETLGPGKMSIEDRQKVGTVTGTSLHSNEEELEELNEAERLIKEAHDRSVD